MYFLGGVLGGLALIGLLTAGVFKLLSRRMATGPAFGAAWTLVLTIAVILGGYGNADGGAPDFAASFNDYVGPALIVLIAGSAGLFRKGRPKSV